MSEKERRELDDDNVNMATNGTCNCRLKPSAQHVTIMQRQALFPGYRKTHYSVMENSCEHSNIDTIKDNC